MEASIAPMQVSDRLSSPPPASMTESVVWILNWTDYFCPGVFISQDLTSAFPLQTAVTQQMNTTVVLPVRTPAGGNVDLYTLYRLNKSSPQSTCIHVLHIEFSENATFCRKMFYFCFVFVFIGRWVAKRGRVCRRWQKSLKRAFNLNNSLSRRPKEP